MTAFLKKLTTTTKPAFFRFTHSGGRLGNVLFLEEEKCCFSLDGEPKQRDEDEFRSFSTSQSGLYMWLLDVYVTVFTYNSFEAPFMLLKLKYLSPKFTVCITAHDPNTTPHAKWTISISGIDLLILKPSEKHMLLFCCWF